jgi:3-methyladenine DNA glycosylase AlkD
MNADNLCMTDTIQSKATAGQLLQNAIDTAGLQDMKQLADVVNKEILTKKIKFPAIEHSAKLLHKQLDSELVYTFCDELIKPKTIGCWVIVGILLQLRLKDKLEESLNKAIEYIIEGNEWYVCDIVGERVMGYGLLKYPDKMLPLLPQLAAHPDKWIVRTVGVAAHYATKKGMQAPQAEEVFKLLLSLAKTTDFHTKKGIGWGAKTISKFHPQIIEKYKSQIFDNPEVKRWFVTKVNIGINWRKYKGKE